VLGRFYLLFVLFAMFGCVSYERIPIDDFTPGAPYDQKDGIAHLDQIGTITQTGCVQLYTAREFSFDPPLSGYFQFFVDGGITEHSIRSVNLESSFKDGNLPPVGQEVTLDAEPCSVSKWCLEISEQNGTVKRIEAGELFVDLDRDSGWLHAEFSGYYQDSEGLDLELSGYIEGTLDLSCGYCAQENCTEYDDLTFDTWPPTESSMCQDFYSML
jgi:hypothetical protein